MTLVAVGAGSPAELDDAIQAFEAAGFRSEKAFRDPGAGDLLVPLEADAAGRLREADSRGLKYQLVHVGASDGLTDGSFARAHHRVASGAVPALAEKLRSRNRLLVRVLAFGYKHGLPADADWVIDVRYLKNPYWVPELRDLDGRDPRVRAYVLAQKESGVLLARLTDLFSAVLPAHPAQGRMAVTIAFGCTGGRHRSVALAGELAARLSGLLDADVETGFGEL